MKTWTISKRITVGFTILTIITIALGIAGYISLNRVGSSANILVTENMPGALILGQVKDNLSRGYANIERIVRASDDKKRDEATKIYDSLTQNNSDLYAEYEKTIISDEDKNDYEKLLVVRKAYAQSIATLFDTIKKGDIAATYDYLDGDFNKQYTIYRNGIDDILKSCRDDSNTLGKDIRENIAMSNVVILVAILIALVLAIVIAFVIIRGTNKVLEKAIVSIDEGSSQVAAASSQVSSASNMLAEGASEQAASLEETSSSLEEMSSMTARNATSAQEAKALADGMRDAADSSAEQMKQMQAAMDAIKESSTGISQIIKTIDEIAFQTNILALNAAVEAARAGEAGAGFAVVAGEVRNLAQRSAESAKETSVKIEGAIRNSDRGVAISAKVAESLNTIVEKARTMDSLVSEIATASQEQDKGIGQLTTAVQQMDKVTQANASNAEETASASEELNAHADSLKETVVELVSLVHNNNNDNNTRFSTSASAPTSSGRQHMQTASSFQKTLKPRTGVKQSSTSDKHFLPMTGKDEKSEA
jgi:methyl-accepting chemotaxis protein